MLYNTGDIANFLYWFISLASLGVGCGTWNLGLWCTDSAVVALGLSSCSVQSLSRV